MEVKLLGTVFRLEIIIIAVIAVFLLLAHSVCSCCFWKKGCKKGHNHNQQQEHNEHNEHHPQKEGFTPANTNYGESSSYTLGQTRASHPNTWGTSDMMVTPGTTTWGQPNLTIAPGKPISQGAQDIINRKGPSLPLPEGELLLFSNTEFKPECCPNSYSNGSGCACMNPSTYNYLILRGGNNIPYSEY